MVSELSVEKLRKICRAELVKCESSADVQPLQEIVGQERAVKALRFGLDIKGLGFNIYVAGIPGTGRETAVKRFLESVAERKPVPSDWCYVHNFKNAYHPKALRLPAGQAREFQTDMRELVTRAKRDIRTAFDGDEYSAKREEMIQNLNQQQERLFQRISERAKQEDFMLKPTPMGMLAIALKDAKPVDDEQFLSLSQEEQNAITQKRSDLRAEIQQAIREAKDLERKTDKALQRLDQEIALYALNHLIEDLQEKYQTLPDVIAYLNDVKRDILDNISDFRTESQAQAEAAVPQVFDKQSAIKRYEVNVLVDNSELKGAPVITELNPTYNNLFGRIDKEAQFGTMITDFTMIREGCLHRANGGYLVLPVEEVLRNLFSWDSLKRALRNQAIAIEEAGERLGFITTQSLRPEPVPLEVKVVLIGPPTIYYLLNAYDNEFNELFKVKADFDIQMERTAQHISHYLAFTARLCEDEGLKALDGPALGKVIEHGSRLAEDQEKLSTRFHDLANVIREASFYAEQTAAPVVTAAHIRQAIDEKLYRSNLLQERIRDMIADDQLLIDVAGEVIGQVNGLSVIDLGDIRFGRPSRITASTGVGSQGVIDIERKAELGGPIHTKGVMILNGYLTEKYAQNTPLNLAAHLVFEQSYGGVEGDSASSTELYALLSSLSQLPVMQGIAVTGSVNQKGRVQAIGGVNEKIEGFFEVCQVKGLTGRQGVLIPASNVKNLMLKEDVVGAVKEGMFHIWPVQTIDEGIEILTGVKAGRLLDDGMFEDNSVNRRVAQQLSAFAEATKAFAGVARGEKEAR